MSLIDKLQAAFLLKEALIGERIRMLEAAWRELRVLVQLLDLDKSFSENSQIRVQRVLQAVYSYFMGKKRGVVSVPCHSIRHYFQSQSILFSYETGRNLQNNQLPACEVQKAAFFWKFLDRPTEEGATHISLD